MKIIDVTSVIIYPIDPFLEYGHTKIAFSYLPLTKIPSSFVLYGHQHEQIDNSVSDDVLSSLNNPLSTRGELTLEEELRPNPLLYSQSILQLSVIPVANDRKQETQPIVQPQPTTLPVAQPFAKSFGDNDNLSVSDFPTDDDENDANENFFRQDDNDNQQDETRHPQPQEKSRSAQNIHDHVNMLIPKSPPLP